MLYIVQRASDDISRPFHPDTTCACTHTITHSLSLSPHARARAHTTHEHTRTHTHTHDRARTHAHEDRNRPAHAQTHTHKHTHGDTTRTHNNRDAGEHSYTRHPTVATPLTGPPPSSHLPHRSSHAQTGQKGTLGTIEPTRTQERNSRVREAARKRAPLLHTLPSAGQLVRARPDRRIPRRPSRQAHATRPLSSCAASSGREIRGCITTTAQSSRMSRIASGTAGSAPYCSGPIPS
jgi:hypothetical protein